MQTIDTGSYMSTFTGKYINPDRLSVDDINIIDIATGLSRTCRFAGQCSEFYSVAQHSVYVSKYSGNNPDLTPKENLQNARIGLLHDAPEAYIGDLVKCVKACLSDYQVLEDRVWEVIVLKFDLACLSQLSQAVIEADNRVLINERLVLINDKSAVWSVENEWAYYPQLHIEGGWDPNLAKRIFLEKFQALWPSESIL